MPLANLRSSIASWWQVTWSFARPAAPSDVTDGYRVDYSEPSEKALNAADPAMKAFIARSTVVSVEGEV